MHTIIAELGGRVLAGQSLSADHGQWLATVAGDDLYDLFYWANRVRLSRFGRAITFCSIAAGKVGGCSEDCRFCAQSGRYRTDIETQRPTTEQLVLAARDAADRGATCFGIVNSGRGPSDADLDHVTAAFAGIAASFSRESQASAGAPIGLCASLGQLSPGGAGRLYAAGVRRYHHNLETSRRFFPQIVTTHSFGERIETLNTARAVGMQLCSGGLFNLGESWADRVDMALTLRELAVNVVPLNFLHPIPGTPMADRPPMHPQDILKVVAVYRLLLADQQIKVAGGREVNLRDLQSWMFYCGASSGMTGNYLTTCGRGAADDRRMIEDLGLMWSTCNPG